MILSLLSSTVPIRYQSPKAARSRPSRQVFHTIATIIAVGYLVLVLTVAILSSFAEGLGLGVRSLAAAIVPLLIIFYLGFLSGVEFPANRSRSPLINNFVLFSLWTLLVMSLVAAANAVWFPLLELLYSLTLAGMIWRFKQGAAFSHLAACSYGVICGSLLFTVVFGWPHGG